MQRISSSGATGDNRLKESPAPATCVTAAFLNTVMDELANAMEDPRGGNEALTAGNAVNGERTVADVGLSGQYSTSATVRLDPLYAGGATSLAKASSASGTAGTGSVPTDYTLASGSPCKAAVPGGVLPYDWGGNVRSATSDTAGAWA